MLRIGTRLLVWMTAASLLACAGRQAGEDRPGGTGGATTVRGEELTGSPVLLDALLHAVHTLRVSRPAARCPIIVVRGQAGGREGGSAAVYVDGTRMRDTCVLEQIQSATVERVELYPVAARPTGYTAGPGGLVLVFTRR